MSHYSPTNAIIGLRGHYSRKNRRKQMRRDIRYSEQNQFDQQQRTPQVEGTQTIQGIETPQKDMPIAYNDRGIVLQKQKTQHNPKICYNASTKTNII